MKHLFAAILVSAALGCGSSSEGAKELSTDEAKAKATAVLPGTVTDVQREEAKGDEPALVVVTVKQANGASIDFEYVAADGSLFEIKSEAPPFDGYELTPRAGVLAYTAAKAKALAVNGGAVEVWEFQAQKSVWEFYVRDADKLLWEIKLNATDGSRISVVQKAAAD